MNTTQERFANTGKTCDFSQWLQFYAADVIGEITWSKRLGFIETGEDVESIISSVDELLAYAAMVSRIPTEKIQRSKAHISYLYQIGQMPILDYTLLDKNPIKMFLGRHNLWKSSSPIAEFALARSRERRLGMSTNEKPTATSDAEENAV